MQAQYLYGEQTTVRFTPSGAVSRNTVNIVGTTPGGIAGVAMSDIAASTEGALTVEGVFAVVKITEHVFNVGDTVYWNATASPQTGAGGSGAATATAEDAVLGVCVEACTEDADTVTVSLDFGVVPSA
jgi:predicted RecA/RadA family phage recombinase